MSENSETEIQRQRTRKFTRTFAVYISYVYTHVYTRRGIYVVFERYLKATLKSFAAVIAAESRRKQALPRVSTRFSTNLFVQTVSSCPCKNTSDNRRAFITKGELRWTRISWIFFSPRPVTPNSKYNY